MVIIIIVTMIIYILPPDSGRHKMHLEENIEAHEQKPHHWSIGDPSESNDHNYDCDDDGPSGGYKYGNHQEKEGNDDDDENMWTK